MGVLTFLEGRLRHLGTLGARDPGALWVRWGRRAHYKAQGLDYLTRAAELNHPEGLLELGLFYASGGHGLGGQGVALDLFRRSAEQGNVEAAFHLAEMLRWAGQTEEALRWYEASAAAGYGPSMFWLVKAFRYADGVEAQDLDKAAQWEARLVELGTPEPPRRSALMAQPEEPDLDPLVRFTRAVRDGLETWMGPWVHKPWFPLCLWTALGALAGWILVLGGIVFLDGGIIGAFFALPLGVSLLIGLRIWMGLRRGRSYSRAQSLVWVRAFKGDPESCFRYGLALKQGTADIPKDLAEARVWFEKAARNGHLEAMVHLAELQRWGAGGPRLTGEARSWLQRAAEGGHPQAADQLQHFPQNG